MRKVLLISVMLSVGFVFGVTWNELSAHAAGGGGVRFGSGDVNGDGTIDISDGVYILRWLFTGGEAPVGIECPAPAAKGLPSTGQTKCYDNSGRLIHCASVDFPGQDGFHQAGCPSEGRFLDNGDGTVTDTCTGLMWQKETADVDGNGRIADEDRLDWQSALEYCDDLVFAGHDDWRLPNVQELLSIVDYGRSGRAIDPVFGELSDWYWSSSTGADYPRYAWDVSFLEGGVNGYADKVFGDFVRAVRSGP